MSVAIAPPEHVHRLLCRLRRAGVGVALVGDSLKVRAAVGLITDADRADLKASREGLIVQLRTEAELHAIPRVADTSAIELSAQQEHLWMLAELAPETAAFNIPLVLKIAGLLDEQALGHAVYALEQRHRQLGLTLKDAGGRVRVAFDSNPVAPLFAENLQPSAVAARIAAVVNEAFDVNGGRLFRSAHLRAGDDSYVLLITHHIVSDLWSTVVLADHLTKLYATAIRGESIGEAATGPSYGDFASWQRRFLGSRLAAGQRGYWRETLDNVKTRARLPLDRAYPVMPAFFGSQVNFTIEHRRVTALAALGGTRGATLFMVFVAVFGAALAAYSGGEDVLIGTPIAGRRRRELEAVVGYFANMLPLRVPTNPDQTFFALLMKVREIVLGAFDNQDIPISELIRDLRSRRQIGDSSLFNVCISYLPKGPGATLHFGSQPAERFDAGLAGVHLYDLSLTLRESGDSIEASMHYRTELFDRDTVGRIVDRFARLLDLVIERPEQTVAHLIADELSTSGEVSQDNLEYWKTQLAGAPPTLELPTDRPRQAIKNSRSERIEFALPSGLTARLRSLCEERKLDFVVPLLAGWSMLLSRWSGQSDVVCAIAGNRRPPGDHRHASGLSNHLLPLRVLLDDGISVELLLKRVDECLQAAEAHPAALEQIIDYLQPTQNSGHHPLFQAMLAVEGASTENGIDALSADRVDLTMRLKPAGNELVGVCVYAGELFDASTIERLVAQFCRVLESVADDQRQPLGSMTLLPASEREQVLGVFNATRAEYPADQCIHELIQRQVERTPDATALIFDENRLSFAELNGRANQLARRLQAQGVREEAHVGVCLERSIEMVVGLLAILKAGGAYVPLEPGHPTEQLAYMLEDSAPVVLLTQQRFTPLLVGVQIPLLILDAESCQREIDAFAADNLSAVEAPSRTTGAAYVIYTSGSTGWPKGVVNQHDGVVNRLWWAQRTYGLQQDDRVLQKTPFGFDVSVWEFFLPLLAGAQLVVARPGGHQDPRYLMNSIERAGITTVHFVPSMLQAFLRDVPSCRCPSLRRVLCSGEALPYALQLQFHALFPHCELHNLYGPTEAAIDVTAWQCVPDRHVGIVPIGRPISNIQIYVLDSHRQPVPIGVRGEIYIGGIGVARGYLNRSELTAERFVADPFGDAPQGRLYRTGDVGRWLADGTVEYLGREDFQVKIRGHRIELAGIESRLAACDGVQEALVMAHESQPGDKRLVAYIAPSSSHALPVQQLLQLQMSGTELHDRTVDLPNGMTIFHQNAGETRFLYDEIFEQEVYLRHGVVLCDDACVVDVGANIGLFSLFVGRRCHNATIYAFEPIPPVFDSLRLNARLYGLKGKVFECGLSNRPGQQNFTFYPRNTVVSSSTTSASDARRIVKSFLQNQQSQAEFAADEHALEELLDARLVSRQYACELRTLSDIIAEEAIPFIHLLKIDVENAELDVLEGIAEEHWPKIGQVVVEMHDVAGRRVHLSELLRSRGFDVVSEEEKLLQGTNIHTLYASRPVGTREAQIKAPPAATACTWASRQSLLRSVRAELSRQLPEYMLPSAYVLLDKLPLTVNGKVDRNALPSPDQTSVVTRPYEAPAGEVESAIAGIWRDLLGVDLVGRHDNFFELGGHSLLATQAVVRLRHALGIDLPLLSIFEAPSLAALAVQLGAADLATGPTIAVLSRKQGLPMSFSQDRLWFLQQLEATGAAYHVPVLLRLRGTLDVEALRRAFADLIERHESLRTRFISREGMGLQQIDPPWTLSMPVRKVGTEEREAWLLACIARPFDLEHEYLLRVELLECAADEHLLLIIQHHLITDGWSVGILLEEMSSAYRARCRGHAAQLAPLPIQYADWAVWQRRVMDSARVEVALAWWRERLSGVPVALELPTDAPRPAVQSYRGASHSVEIPASLGAALRGLAQSEGATLFMVLLSAWQIVLSRWSGQEDLVVGTPIAGRTHSQVEGLLGFFVNTLALRADLRGLRDYRSHLRRVRETTLDAYAHQDLPFERVVDALCPVRDLSRQALFQVMFVLQNTGASAGHEPAEATRPAPLHLERVELTQRQAKFDLTLNIEEHPQGLRASLEYASDLFERSTIERMCGHFQNVLAAIAADPDQALHRIELLSSRERQQQLEDWNVAQHPTSEQDLASLVRAQALRAPQAVAVEYLGQSLSYAELELRAERLAGALHARGVRREEIIGIHAERSLHLLPALLGILKSGGAFLPIDPQYPIARQQYMLRDAGVRWLLSAGGELSFELEGLERLDLAALLLGDGEEGTEHPAPAPILADQLAYVIYTSGSTGHPKGAALTHRGAVNLYDWYRQRYALCESRRVLVVSSFSFDLTLKNAFAPLLGGATVVLGEAGVQDGARLLSQLQDNAVHLLNCAPAQYYLVLESLQQRRRQDIQVCLPNSLQYVVLGGEALRNDRLLARGQGGNQHARTINSYGPTEATDVVADGEVLGPGQGGLYTVLGRGIDNSRLYVLDRHGQLAPAGAVGELHIGGPALARGYLGRAGLTAERFIPDPFNPGQRLYRTGDRVRWRADGQLDYLGRLDHQVKLRGYRVELGEIESQLLRHPGVRDAVVMVQERGGHAQLCAYLVAGETPPSRSELAAALRRELPDYMVPNQWTWLERLPLTPSGKLDRHALPLPTDDEIDGTIDHAPLTPTEQLIADLFAELLARNHVARHDNFFELGGHSLSALQLISRLRERLGIHLSLRLFFAHPTPHGLAQAAKTALPSDHSVIGHADRSGPLPLSWAQQRLWFLHELERTSSAAYHIPAGVRLQGTLNRAALRSALDTIVARHEILRTRFRSFAHDPVQEVDLATAGFELREHDLGGSSAEERERAIRQHSDAEASAPFDLSLGPLIRGRLLRAAPDDHILLVTQHHIISDGWSVGIMLREVAALYTAFSRGESNPLPPLPIQYADYAVWQRSWLQGKALDKQIRYWKKQLAGAPPLLELYTDRPRPAEQSFAGDVVRLELDPELVQGLKALSARHGLTPFMTVLAAWSAVLSRLSGQEDVVIGTPVANRTRTDIEGLIGFFVNTLALRIAVSGSARELLECVKTCTLDAQSHQDLPFEQVVDIVRPPRSLSYTPIFQAMLSWRNREDWGIDLPSLRATPLEVCARTAKFDLSLDITESADSLVGELEYATSLFDRSSIERQAAYLKRMLAAMVADEHGSVDAVDLLGPDERRQVLEGWNQTRRPIPGECCIHNLFELQAARTPQACAVVEAAEQVTYSDLNRRANQLAHHLCALGVKPDDRVAICAERGIEMVVGMLAVLKAGGAYVPLDLSYPLERLHHMLHDSGCVVLLTSAVTASHVSLVEAAARDGTHVRDMRTDAGRWAHEPGLNLDRETLGLRPQNLAYVIYTSGSTGVPKGVMIEHASVVNLIYAHIDNCSLTSSDCVLQFASFAFDASVEEIFPPLTVGARMVLRPAALVAPDDGFLSFMRASAITVAELPTAFFHEWAQQPAAADASSEWMPRLIVIGGEKAEWRYIDRWRAAHGSQCELLNTYGPTEATVYASASLVEPGTGSCYRSVSIGRPISNTRILVLDLHGRPAPIGVVGEIHIGGAGVARGYLNRPALSVQRFIADSFDTDASARLYRTGDLGRWHADGHIEFVGRNDDQVKIRGFRVELGEIETRLAEYPRVADVRVVVREDEPGNAQLVAYLTPAIASPGELDIGELRAYLGTRLPAYMVPAAYVTLDHFPLTPSGKLDRHALPAPHRKELVTISYEAPQGLIESTIADVFGQVLNVDRVGRLDNFFQLGGHSLLLVRASALLAERLGKKIALFEFFSHPSVAALATCFDTTTDIRAAEFAICLRAEPGVRHAVLFMPTILGSGSAFARLARRLHIHADMLTCRLPGTGAGETPLQSIGEMADFVCEQLVSTARHTSWSIVGWSFGGILAYEVARRMSAIGLKARSVVIIDSYLPPSSRDKITALDSQIQSHLERELGAGIGALVDTGRMAAMFKVNDHAMHEYTAPGYDGNVLELRASASAALLTGVTSEVLRPLPMIGSEVQWLPTEHYSMMSDAELPLLAEAITRFLSRASAFAIS